MTTKINSHFTLYGDFDPDELTSIIDITPDATWRRGDRYASTLVTFKTDAWRISVFHEGQGSCDAYTNELLQRLEGKHKIIRNLLKEKKLEASISHIIYVDDNEVPIIDVNVATMKKPIDINADIDIDLYCL